MIPRFQRRVAFLCEIWFGTVKYVFVCDLYRKYVVVITEIYTYILEFTILDELWAHDIFCLKRKTKIPCLAKESSFLLSTQKLIFHMTYF